MSGYWQETITEQDMGYDVIPIIRPSFVAFKFTGLRPNSPHWVFFDNVLVNDYVNTSYGIDDIREGANAETFTNPGDQFITETGFPTSLGGPSTGPFNTDASGDLEGMLYIQSNTDLSFTVGSKKITVIDLSVNKPQDALSYATAEVSFEGVYELYSENITQTWIQTYGGYNDFGGWTPGDGDYGGLADGGQNSFGDFGGGNNGGTSAGSAGATGGGGSGATGTGGNDPGNTGGSMGGNGTPSGIGSADPGGYGQANSSPF